MPRNFDKDPDAVLDYQVNWAPWLDDDTISTSAWDAPEGITKDSDAYTTTAATIWLSGGTVGQIYIVTNRIVTAGGRTDDRSLHIKVVER